MGRGAPGFGGSSGMVPGAQPGAFGELGHHHPLEPGRGRGFAAGRGRGLIHKGAAHLHLRLWGHTIGLPTPGLVQ